MKKIFYSIIILTSLGFALPSCSEWTEIEADLIDVPGRSDEYYADLRAWKATALDREVSFGWFGGWTGLGASLSSSLIGLPDSMDVVSIWGDWMNLTEARAKDLKRAQEVMGLKVMACTFAQRVGEGFTPADSNAKDYWGWDPEETGLKDEPTESQQLAIRKYARAMAEKVIELGYDGLDLDYEPNFGHVGDLASSKPRMRVFMEELGKYFGPKSGTNRLLAVDGEPQTLPKEAGPYCTWFIVQAYDCTGYKNLNMRLKTTIDNFAGVMEPKEVAKRYIATENFEKAIYNTTGGREFTQEDGSVVRSYAGMAGWQPLYSPAGGKEERFAKGGCGTFHMEYAYTAPNQSGFYPFVRETIRIMNRPKSTN